jgi:hypothetical protein
MLNQKGIGKMPLETVFLVQSPEYFSQKNVEEYYVVRGRGQVSRVGMMEPCMLMAAAGFMAAAVPVQEHRKVSENRL